MKVRVYIIWQIIVPQIIMLTVCWFSLAYAKNDPPLYVGCFKGLRVGSISGNDRMTVRECHSIWCYNLDYMALLRGEYCGCFSLEAWHKENLQTSTECNLPCVGNKKAKVDDMCGGPYVSKKDQSYSVYRLCQENKFGPDCKNECHCGTGGICSTKTGRCYGGNQTCQSGWKGWPECQIRDCQENKFGPNCRNECHCGTGGICNTQTGECYGGNQTCQSGWKGWPMCQINCEDGSYGQDCKGKCSWHCANNLTCFIKDGTCPTGCQQNYMGPRCDIKNSTSNNLSGETYVIIIIASLVILLVEDYVF